MGEHGHAFDGFVVVDDLAKKKQEGSSIATQMKTV